MSKHICRWVRNSARRWLSAGEFWRSECRSMRLWESFLGERKSKREREREKAVWEIRHGSQCVTMPKQLGSSPKNFEMFCYYHHNHSCNHLLLYLQLLHCNTSSEIPCCVLLLYALLCIKKFSLKSKGLSITMPVSGMGVFAGVFCTSPWVIVVVFLILKWYHWLLRALASSKYVLMGINWFPTPLYMPSVNTALSFGTWACNIM